MKKTGISLLFIILSLSLFAQDVYQAERASWLEKAEQAKPALMETICKPLYLVRSVQDPDAFQGWRTEKSEEMDALYNISFKEKKEVIADFGKHITGYYSFFLKTTYRTQDAPLRIKFTFAEVPAELNTPFDPYPGTLSRAWLQDEIVTITQVDQEITIPRRLSFRYVKIELLGYSPDFDFRFADMTCKAVSSAQDIQVPLAATASEEIKEINRVSLETLKECMQTVYEDGPKRDMRLWIGDLYLESLANTYSFKNHDLTKRCLYLLAGLASTDGRLHANVFENPEPHPQYESHCLDYSLLYNVTLLEYLKATGDKETAEDLWPVVTNQVKEALGFVNDKYMFDPYKKEGFLWLFFDWRDGLDRNVAIQGLMVYALNSSYELAKMLGKEKEVKEWPEIAKKMAKAARSELYDSKQGVFVSGPDNQVSYLSQVWMILSGVASPAEGKKALNTVFWMPDAVYPGAPYAYHYLIEAMIKAGMNDQAKEYLVTYWGGMVKKGADTFWEVYDPNNEYLSPYNFFPVNSYCHAWSCTPVYFIQKYPEIFQQ
ncbi:MAG: glycoside hydrolase [Candidatus Azobacteroides sp.]|nr:glycoside hydrolase [Candidatus Azobacteroides sp.]